MPDSHVTNPPLLELNHISRSFGSVRALDDVSLSVHPGEVHALLGENGAGKTTLLNIAFGLVPPHAGEIIFGGRPLHGHTPRQAIDLGMGMVHQHFKLVEEFTVAENVALGSPRAAEALSNTSELQQLAREAGLDVDLQASVQQLPVAMRQRVEILKALYRGARLLILDEPTAVLSPPEVTDLFAALNRLKAAGTSIVIITHKLREALAIATRITVLRAGRAVLSLPAAAASEEDLIKAMIGEQPVKPLPDRSPPDQKTCLSVSDLCCTAPTGSGLRGAAFNVRRGEILGIAGVEGNGQAELAAAVAGVNEVETGSIILHSGGKEIDLTHMGVVERRRLGVMHIPSDRQTQALALEMPLTENLLLGTWDQPGCCRMGVVSSRRLQERAEAAISSYGIRGASASTQAMALSGGSQQRFVVARELAEQPVLVVASNPTRGLDVGAAGYVHQKLLQARNDGATIILTSTDLEETLALSDRILILYEGCIALEEHPPFDRERIGAAMAGGSKGS